MQYPFDFAVKPLASAVLGVALASSLPAIVQATESTAAEAREQRFTFAIAAQPLADALDQFSAQSGYQVLYQANQVDGLRSPGVQGRFSAEQAIQRLVGDTGARLSQPNANSFLDLPTNLGSGELQLEA